MDWSNKNVLVTGGHGFLGLHLIEALNNLGCTPFAPKSSKCDLRHFEQVKGLIAACSEKAPLDYIFHLAADVGGIGYNQRNPYYLFANNIQMGLNLIHYSIGNVGKFIQVGTACAYPANTMPPFAESNLWSGYPEVTNAPYGIAKRVLLTQLQAARQQFDFNGIYVIPANLYGPGDKFNEAKSHVIPALIKKVIEAQDTLEVWGDGTATRDFMFVKDCVKGLILAAETYNEPEPLNLGSGQAVSIAMLVDMLKSLTNKNLTVNWDTSKPNGQAMRQLDISKALALGWQPETDLKTGLELTIGWYKCQKLV